jgi:hypothetical protein
MLTKTEYYEIQVPVDSLPEELPGALASIPKDCHVIDSGVYGGNVTLTFKRQVAV